MISTNWNIHGVHIGFHLDNLLGMETQRLVPAA